MPTGLKARNDPPGNPHDTDPIADNGGFALLVRRVRNQQYERWCWRQLPSNDGRAFLVVSPPQQDYIRVILRLAKSRPSLHQGAPLFERITAPIGLLDRATGSVRKSLLGNLSRE